MGLDLIDLNFRLEKRFGIRLRWDEWGPLAAGRERFDLTAAEVCTLVEARRDAMRRHVRWQADGSGPMVLDYERGGALTTDDREATWPGVRDAIVEVCGQRPELVRPDSWLVRDLGFSI